MVNGHRWRTAVVDALYIQLHFLIRNEFRAFHRTGPLASMYSNTHIDEMSEYIIKYCRLYRQALKNDLKLFD